MISNILRNFMVWVDGNGLMGSGDTCKLPELSLKMEEYRGGGMDTPLEIELGTEKLESEFTLNGIDPQIYKLFGLAPGINKAYTIRGHLASEDGTTTGIVVNMRARIKKIVCDNWEAGAKTKSTISLAVDYMKIKHGSSLLIEIDPTNGVRIVNGVDQLANQRVNLGL
jgi:uncharacterized protein